MWTAAASFLDTGVETASGRLVMHECSLTRGESAAWHHCRPSTHRCTFRARARAAQAPLETPLQPGATFGGLLDLRPGGPKAAELARCHHLLVMLESEEVGGGRWSARWGVGQLPATCWSCWSEEVGGGRAGVRGGGACGAATAVAMGEAMLVGPQPTPVAAPARLPSRVAHTRPVAAPAARRWWTRASTRALPPTASYASCTASTRRVLLWRAWPCCWARARRTQDAVCMRGTRNGNASS